MEARHGQAGSRCKLIAHPLKSAFTRPFTCEILSRGTQSRCPHGGDSANVVQDVVVVGKAYLSMSAEEPLVNVCVEEAVLPPVLEWAEELEDEFCREWRGLLEK